MHFMKLFPLILSLLFQGSFALADSYQFSTSDNDLGKIVLVKDCLDYTFCGGEGASLAGGNPDYRLHTFIELTDKQFRVALNVCNFAKIGVKVSIKNLTKNTFVTVPDVDTGKDMRSSVPTVFMGNVFGGEQTSKYNKIKVLMDDNKKQEAVDAVLAEYGISTAGYSVKFGGNMGKAGAVTDHQLKTVTVSDSAFSDPCILILTMRHELEHVAQFSKVTSCAAQGRSHNFTDHVTRERSAYLNDIRNIPLVCPDKNAADQVVDFLTATFFKNYSSNR